VNGSYDLNFRDTLIEDSELNLKGSGDIVIYTNKNLVVNSDAVGNVYYLGKPKISKNISFMTTIQKLKEDE
jgi:hypothetical protein